MMNNASAKPYLELTAFDDSGDLNVIVETPKGSRNKFGYDETLGLFKLDGVLPAGASFPFDFGFIPATVGGDGDPLDVLLLLDESVFTGCLVAARTLGVIEAKQKERDGATMRNDRLIAVAAKSSTHGNLKTLLKLNSSLLEEIEYFFISYNNFKGKEFMPLGRFGPERANKLIKEGARRFQRA
ncbi:MAG: inorganic pyrophosphatase [Blastocatellia bacterium]|jgi:inorganic pyrophosphatase|nr:inorganic pyrophosphatase [Blastocatellia bacterium]